MVVRFATDLQTPFARERLEPYRSNSGTDLEMLTNYFWNIDLAKALVPAMHAVEAALRNTLHTTLSTHFASDMWFYENEVLESNQLRDFAFALGKVAKKPKPWSGRIVAELNFGFWTSLLNAPYEQRIWQPNGYALLFTAFPAAVGVSRKVISDRFTEIKDLRNRVFHHEPVWHRQKLLQDHAHIHQALGWIHPALHQGIHVVDDFTDVHQHGRLRVYNRLHSFLGGP